jgi:hypothetical protein
MNREAKIRVSFKIVGDLIWEVVEVNNYLSDPDLF